MWLSPLKEIGRLRKQLPATSRELFLSNEVRRIKGMREEEEWRRHLFRQ